MITAKDTPTREQVAFDFFRDCLAVIRNNVTGDTPWPLVRSDGLHDRWLQEVERDSSLYAAYDRLWSLAEENHSTGDIVQLGEDLTHFAYLAGLREALFIVQLDDVGSLMSWIEACEQALRTRREAEAAAEKEATP
jgi:hypothetical protein